MSRALVTVGIPAYNREAGLRRALASVVAQDHPRLEVIVSDDCSPGADLERVVRECGLESVRFVRQERNLGLAGNAMWLVEQARGEYFMWLADDDEISANYVSSLAAVLDREPEVVTAMGVWERVRDEGGERRKMPQLPLRTTSAIARAASFIRRGDDAFFYGLHRTDVLRRATFAGYWRPIRDEWANWCYVYLMDVVLRGQVALTDDPTVRWTAHDYEPKHYRSSRGSEPARWALRRVNVHAEYHRKIARTLGWAASAVLLPLSVMKVGRELTVLCLRRARAALVRAIGRGFGPASPPATGQRDPVRF